MKRILLLLPVIAALTAAFTLGGCTPVGAGLAVGSTIGAAATREGGLKASLEDTRISAKIQDLWLKYDTSMFIKLNLTVDQGRVLITGVVQAPEHRVEAVRLAWQAEGVRQVINEVKVDNSEGIKGWARDTWIAGRLRALILFDKDIQGVNYSIDTVQGIVYLMGIAQTQGELDAVMSHARTVPYVKQVVSYVKLAGTPMNQVIPPTMPGNGPAGTTPAAPGPDSVASEPLFSRTAVPSGQYDQDQLGGGQYDARAPLPVPPRAGVMAPGRPAPIVDSGF